MKTHFMILSICFMLLSCNTSPLNQNFDKEALLKEAKTVAHDFLDNLAKNDTSAIISLPSENPDFRFIIYGDIYNRQDFLTMARKMLPNIEKQTFENTKETFSLLSPQIFIYSYKSLNKMIEKTGVITTIDPIVGSYTFQKEQGKWKLIHMQENYINMKVDSSMVKK